MSEQGKSNFQAFGAGLFGFVAVMAIGGGALLVHNSRAAKAGAKPEAAAVPIDLGSSMPRTPLSPASAQKERRAQSPAPLIGDEHEVGGSEAPAGASEGAVVSSPETAARAQSTAPRLEATQHLDKPGNGSSATAIVKNTLSPEEAPQASGQKLTGKKALLKLDPAGGGAIASVHYGASNRSELMGRAAGPVYNFKGKGKSGGSAASGKMADDVKGKIADIKRQLDAAGLSAEERAKLEKDLDAVNKGVEGAAAQ